MGDQTAAGGLAGAPALTLLCSLGLGKRVGCRCQAGADVCGPLSFWVLCVQTLQYLQQNARERAELAATATASSTASLSAPAAASRISTQELEELRKQLGSVATGSTLQQVL